MRKSIRSDDNEYLSMYRNLSIFDRLDFLETILSTKKLLTSSFVNIAINHISDEILQYRFDRENVSNFVISHFLLPGYPKN